MRWIVWTAPPPPVDKPRVRIGREYGVTWLRTPGCLSGSLFNFVLTTERRHRVLWVVSVSVGLPLVLKPEVQVRKGRFGAMLWLVSVELDWNNVKGGE